MSDFWEHAVPARRERCEADSAGGIAGFLYATAPCAPSQSKHAPMKYRRLVTGSSDLDAEATAELNLL